MAEAYDITCGVRARCDYSGSRTLGDNRDLVVELDIHLSSAPRMQDVYAIDRLLLRTTKLEALAYD
jgi:hypothetical protein